MTGRGLDLRELELTGRKTQKNNFKELRHVGVVARIIVGLVLRGLECAISVGRWGMCREIVLSKRKMIPTLPN